MNVGLYQSASALSALERWQDTVSQNITSSQTTGYRKRTVNFATETAGELRANPRARFGGEGTLPVQFPRSLSGINFKFGETQPTRREFDVAIQGPGFFEIQRPDGSRVYTRSGEFRMQPDRTLVTSSGDQVLSEAGAPIILLPNGGNLVINQDGTLFQGTTALGKIAVKNFPDTARLRPIAGGFFVPLDGTPAPETVDNPELLQGYLEASNVTPLREMVDLVLISRAYEANQKMIQTVEQQIQKSLEALG
ncbi:MAG: flagellar hook-basal body protein [Verrucomicrobia bacterium]|nr:flagellar hook-basal body protein [Verrucomicrobiota bacterium]